MFGPDITIDLGEKLIINAQYVRRTDSEVFIEYTNSTLTDVLNYGGLQR